MSYQLVEFNIVKENSEKINHKVYDESKFRDLFLDDKFKDVEEVEFITLRCKDVPQFWFHNNIRKITYCHIELSKELCNLCVHCSNLQEVYFKGGFDAIKIECLFSECPRLRLFNMKGQARHLKSMNKVFIDCPKLIEFWFGFMPKLTEVNNIFVNTGIPYLVVVEDDFYGGWKHVVDYVRYYGCGFRRVCRRIYYDYVKGYAVCERKDLRCLTKKYYLTK